MNIAYRRKGVTVSTLVAVNCGNTRMLPVRDTYEMSMIERAMNDGRSIEVRVYFLDMNEDRYIRIENLHLAKDGWGVEHVEGVIVEDGGVVRVILYDNPQEADPLNLK